MVKKICKWDSDKHENKRCPFHSVRMSEDGLPEMTSDSGKNWEPITMEEYNEMKDSKEMQEVDLNDLRIEMETEDYNSEREGHHDKSTTIYIDDEPVVMLSEVNEDKALSELSDYIKDEFGIEVSLEELKSHLIEKLEDK